jgi:excisionase family DNA binding protein
VPLKTVNQKVCRFPTSLGTSRRILPTRKMPLQKDAQKPVLCLAPMSKKYLTKKELAHELGLTKRGVEELMRSRKIPFLALGHRTVRFVPADVEKSLARFEHKAI